MTVGEWLEAHASSVLARQRATVDTARLLVTFSTGIAATVVATGLQVSPNNTQWDHWATYLLASAGILAMAVFLFDRVREPNIDRVLRDAAAASPPWTQAAILQELRAELLAAPDGNGGFVKAVTIVAVVQALVAGGSGVLAIVGLFQ
jgi:hypothetical protein